MVLEEAKIDLLTPCFTKSIWALRQSLNMIFWCQTQINSENMIFNLFKEIL